MQILNLIIKCEILIVFFLILGNIFLFILLFIQGKIYQQHFKKNYLKEKNISDYQIFKEVIQPALMH
ncbi:hypothetical protein N581_09090 [Lactobacillus jensenii MD IIE-70(2)]|nr:hypothetical protein N581_09090 [Lactobacillus jensenii MD IIE-70(2)]